MDRNTVNRFSDNPTNIDISRSTFDLDHVVKFSGNVGDCIPFDVIEVLPGDTFQIDSNKVVRFQTLLTPIMDNIYLDTYYFFVPNRIVWDHWKEFMGENTESYWIPQTEYAVPQIKAPSNGFAVGTIADYMGIPVNVPDIKVNALPFRAYSVIMNEWFRDENLTQYLNIYTGDAEKTGSNGDDYVNDVPLGGKPFKAAKFKDYFTSCLPAPQKGPDVALPAGYANITAPVIADSSLFNGFMQPDFEPAKFFYMNGSETVQNATLQVGTTNNRPVYIAGASGERTLVPQNLGIRINGASPDNVVNLGTINELRLAFQLQKLYEKDARGGTRYIEQIKSHFGVTSPDARMQRPEYLGGNRIPIIVHQVANTGETESSKLGNVGALSVTTDSHSDFTKSFVEHGFVIGIAVVRYDHTYAQGLERFWSRSDRFDYYWPVLANIGEQAVKVKELYCTGNGDENTFGYNEAWADYRYKPDRVAGEMRPNVQNTLAFWHLADDYNSRPYLSDGWIREDKSNVDRVLAVTSNVSNQFFADFFVKCKATRAMPLYSIPGLIDHH